MRPTRAWTWAATMVVLAGLLASAAGGAWAQEREPRHDSLAAIGDSGTAGAARMPEASPAPYKMPPFWRAATDHMHNKLIHFPIVLTLLAAVMVIVSRRKPELEPVAFWLVWAAALSVIPAYFSGKVAEEHFEGRPKEWLAEVHEKQGITIGVIQALWVLSLLKAGTRRWAWAIGLVLAVMVLASGFIGGLLAHGR